MKVRQGALTAMTVISCLVVLSATLMALHAAGQHYWEPIRSAAAFLGICLLGFYHVVPAAIGIGIVVFIILVFLNEIADKLIFENWPKHKLEDWRILAVLIGAFTILSTYRTVQVEFQLNAFRKEAMVLIDECKARKNTKDSCDYGFNSGVDSEFVAGMTRIDESKADLVKSNWCVDLGRGWSSYPDPDGMFNGWIICSPI